MKITPTLKNERFFSDVFFLEIALFKKQLFLNQERQSCLPHFLKHPLNSHLVNWIMGFPSLWSTHAAQCSSRQLCFILFNQTQWWRWDSEASTITQLWNIVLCRITVNWNMPKSYNPVHPWRNLKVKRCLCVRSHWAAGCAGSPAGRLGSFSHRDAGLKWP